MKLPHSFSAQSYAPSLFIAEFSGLSLYRSLWPDFLLHFVSVGGLSKT